MPKEKSPPVNLDKYLEGRNHKYMTYEKASRLYGLPFWGFVSVAKEAKATCSHIGVRPQCGHFFIVTLHEYVFFPTVAVILALPPFFAVTVPFLLTVAVLTLLLFHLTFFAPFTESLTDSPGYMVT